MKNPNPKALAILVYGPDDGLMRERIATLSKTAVEDTADPFLVATMTAPEINEEPSRFFDEAHAIPMMGGRRLIRIKDGADSLTPILKDYLEKPNDEALVLVEGGDFGPRSSLRKLFEGADNAAALPCYVDDDRSIRQVIIETLRHAGYLADRDTIDFLTGAISGDRLKIRRDLEKLITFMGPDPDYQGLDGPAMDRQLGTVTLDDAREACGETGASGIDDLVIAAGHCDSAKCARALDTLLQEGVSPVWILRALQNHFRRLHESSIKVQKGMQMDQALNSLRPPVFFKQKPDFQRQLKNWRQEALEQVLLDLTELEVRAKSTGSKEETLIGQYLVTLDTRKLAA